MSNTYSPEAQKSIDQAENKLSDAIQNLKSQPKQDNPTVEVVAEDKPDVEVVIDAPTAPQKEVREPRRSEFVKTDDPKVIERINDLYGQVKKSDARNQMIIEHNRQLEQRLAEYVEKVGKLERTTNDNATNKIEADLKQALRIAREDGDLDKVDEIETRLFDIRVEKRLAERIPVTEEKVTKPQQQPQAVPTAADQQLVHNAAYIENLALEKDTNGNLLRPYLYDWHPDNRKVVELFESIPKEFAAAGKQADIKTIMQVLDDRVNGKKQKSSTSVLGAESGDVPTRNIVRLTAQEVEIAKKMGIKPEAYAKQKQLLMS